MVLKKNTGTTRTAMFSSLNVNDGHGMFMKSSTMETILIIELLF